jgi:Zn-dependent peptidase ImmA (M78 family)
MRCMMRKRIEKFEIDSKFIEWSINSSGWDRDLLREKIGVSEKIFESWFEGKAKITLNQLRDLAKRTKRPIASFFLSKVPEEKEMPTDYRLYPEKVGKFDKKTVFAVRKARRLQEIVKSLMSNLYEERKRKIREVKLSESPLDVAKEMRDLFELTEIKQKKFKNSYDFMKFLREKLEEKNIFTFQISMPEEDARGFALSDDFPSIATINSKDSIEARIFTLMHEVGHILLNNTGISIPDFNNKNSIEKWCNEFSSNFLLPNDIAKRIFSERNEILIESSTLKELSRKYKLSKNMLLYNMAKLKFITFEDYNEILKRYKKREDAIRESEEKKSGGGIPAERKCLSELGNKFITLVAENTSRKNITYSDALSYLSIKSKSFDKLMKKI